MDIARGKLAIFVSAIVSLAFFRFRARWFQLMDEPRLTGLTSVKPLLGGPVDFCDSRSYAE